MIQKYKTIIFDCDGVLFNTNRIKTKVFHELSLEYGNDISDDFTNFCINSGGISRYIKFNYLFDLVYQKCGEQIDVNSLLNRFSKDVINGYLNADITKNLASLYRKKKCKWLVVSGSDEEELNFVFSKRGVKHFFDSGIYGSPKSKFEIIDNLISDKKLEYPVLFIGDSKYDYEVASNYNFDFIFLYEWSELNNNLDFCEKYSLTRMSSVYEVSNNVIL